MKKLITAIALTAAIGLFSHSASARWGQGPGNGNGGGFGPGSCGNCDQSSTVDAEARQTFYEETEGLRDQLRTLRIEYFSLVNSEDADKDLAQDLWSQMFDLQQQIQAKATEAGLDPQAGRGGKFRNGSGRGCGNYAGGNNGFDCNGQGCAQNNIAPTE